MDTHVSLHPELTEVAVARRFVSETMGRCGGCGHDRDTAALLVSELVTNAIVHAGTDIDVGVRCDGPVMIVEVRDDSDRMPVEQDVDGSRAAVAGRGIQIVASMADFWGVRSVPGHGKVVWFSLLAQRSPL